MKPNRNNELQQKKKWKPGQPKAKQRKPTNRKNKLHIKFDVEDRRVYLTGFQKRKRERREKAMKQLEEDLKAEMKRIKKDRVDIVKKIMYHGQQLARGLNGEEEEEEEEEGVMVSSCGSAMVEIRGLDLTSSQYHIGTNQMELKKEEKETVKKDKDTSNDGKEVEVEEDVSAEKLDELGIHTQKDLYRSLKKSTFQIMKKSSLMKLKQARDAKKQRMSQVRANNHRKKLRMRKMRHKKQPQSREDINMH